MCTPCRGLIHNKDPGLPQQRASQTEKLPLPRAEVASFFVDFEQQLFT
jgi:hypothetical protein